MKTAIVFVLLCCCLSLSSASVVQPSFNPKDVVRSVRAAHSTTGPLDRLTTGRDDGEFLIDTSITNVGAAGERNPGENRVGRAIDGDHGAVAATQHADRPMCTHETHVVRIAPANERGSRTVRERKRYGS